MVITAVLAGGGGLAAGRATAVESGNEDCAATLTAEKKAEHEAYRIGHEEHRFGHDDGSDPDEWVLSVRTHAYLITQNPNCFSAQERAKAQATLDEFKHYEEG
ncbi:hypothetical protein ACQPXS_18670 [Streptomyces sp. CA-142005]|uniref:hypothetical protein n=1 Tax=Streptomyces sp. CA-142005 TaxID=3240052 RepID=UPI003D8AE16B